VSLVVFLLLLGDAVFGTRCSDSVGHKSRTGKELIFWLCVSVCAP
jgi:hypothetical protein